jgi:hypothetical protein
MQGEPKGLLLFFKLMEENIVYVTIDAALAIKT